MQPKDPLAGISEIPAESGMQPGSLNEELTMKLQTLSRVRRTESCLGAVPRPKIRIPVRSGEVPDLGWTQSWAGVPLPMPGPEGSPVSPDGIELSVVRAAR